MTTDKPSVLLVDDERINLNLLVELLKDDYRTLVAKSGEQALRRAAAEPHPDMILLDVMMPEMDGFEVCRRLKALPATQAIPVIFLSALSQNGDEATGLSLGAVDYISKPLSPAVLKARLKLHLACLASRRQLEERVRQLEARLGETRSGEGN